MNENQQIILLWLFLVGSPLHGIFTEGKNHSVS